MTPYSHTFELAADRATVFRLFSDPRQLDSLTPSWFRLQPIGALPDLLEPGVEISYRLRWRGLPLRWTSLVTDYEENAFLAYEQKRGPYRHFRHEHFFSESDGATRVCDRVVFRTLGGRAADRWVVLPDLKRIFVSRERAAQARVVDAKRIP